MIVDSEARSQGLQKVYQDIFVVEATKEQLDIFRIREYNLKSNVKPSVEKRVGDMSKCLAPKIANEELKAGDSAGKIGEKSSDSTTACNPEGNNDQESSTVVVSMSKGEKNKEISEDKNPSDNGFMLGIKNPDKRENNDDGHCLISIPKENIRRMEEAAERKAKADATVTQKQNPSDNDLMLGIKNPNERENNDDGHCLISIPKENIRRMKEAAERKAQADAVAVTQKQNPSDNELMLGIKNLHERENNDDGHCLISIPKENIRRMKEAAERKAQADAAVTQKQSLNNKQPADISEVELTNGLIKDQIQAHKMKIRSLNQEIKNLRKKGQSSKSEINKLKKEMAEVEKKILKLKKKKQI